MADLPAGQVADALCSGPGFAGELCLELGGPLAGVVSDQELAEPGGPYVWAVFTQDGHGGHLRSED